MRATQVIIWWAVGLGLIGVVQWAGNGAPGLPVAVPDPWGQMLPLAAFLVFGLYLALAFGGTTGWALGALGAVSGLVVAGVPILYALGLAQQYGLPMDGGPLGALYAGPVARAAAALWVPVAIAAAMRRPRSGLVRTTRTVVAPAPDPLPAAPPSEPFWSPAPALQPAERTAVAYTPDEPGRA